MATTYDLAVNTVATGGTIAEENVIVLVSRVNQAVLRIEQLINLLADVNKEMKAIQNA